MSDKTLYNEKSIESLDPRSFCRLKPNVYCGQTANTNQLLVEIVSNAVDEVVIGHGSKIIIESKNGRTYVRDEGQGFLVNHKREEDNKTILEAAFSVLNTSGKYRADGSYNGTSLGNYGIGAKLPIFLSTTAIVCTRQNGKYEKIVFKDGLFNNREIGNTNLPNGTDVEWYPDKQFFGTVDVEDKYMNAYLKTLTCLIPNLEIIYNDKSFKAKNGLNDLVDEAAGDKELIRNRFEINEISGKNKIDLILTYTTNYSSTIVPYVNTGLTESGPHISQIKTALTREFNKFAREKKWLKDKDENLTGDDVQEGMYLVFNLTTTGVTYDAQVKSRITQIDMKPFFGIFTEAIQRWFAANEKEVKLIADKALNARKAREAARKARDAARGVSKKKETGLKAKMQLSNKFIDCVSKNPKERSLLLVEGTSAGSSAVEARNPKTDCIYMLRGKIISPLKTAVDKLLANQEMNDIVRVIGAGFADSFDVSKMNFDKIVITADQDSDGADIELLLITFFFTYMRPLVEAGKLYRAVTPLYIIRQKDKEYYAYSDAELEEWKQSHSGSYDLLRAKGLGELNAQDLQKVCFRDERYKRITISDAAKTTELLEILQGAAVPPRKQYIYDNAAKLGFNFV